MQGDCIVYKEWKMRELNSNEVASVDGGMAALALTGVAEGLEVAAIGGALGWAFGVGYAVGTGLYAGYCYVAY